MLSETERLVIIERHLREVVLPMDVGLKPDALQEMSKRLLFSDRYCFSGDTFWPTFATTECLAQSSLASAKHLFKQHADDTAPVPDQGETIHGYAKADWEKLHPLERMRAADIASQREDDACRKEAAQSLNAAVAAAMPSDSVNWSPQARAQKADELSYAILEARRKAAQRAGA